MNQWVLTLAAHKWRGDEEEPKKLAAVLARMPKGTIIEVHDMQALLAEVPTCSDSYRFDGGDLSDQIGCVRNFVLTDGSKIREQLTAMSDVDCYFAYRILDSGMSLENYHAGLSLFRITDGDATYGVWTATFDCSPDKEAELVDLIGQAVFQAGFDALKSRFQ